jgi:hypothetical protein
MQQNVEKFAKIYRIATMKEQKIVDAKAKSSTTLLLSFVPISRVIFESFIKRGFGLQTCSNVYFKSEQTCDLVRSIMD